MDDPADERSAPPARPPIGDHGPVPMHHRVTHTRGIRLARILWFLSFGFAAAVTLAVFVTSESQSEALHAELVQVAADQDPEAMRALAGLLLWGTLGLTGLVVAAQGMALSSLSKGTAGARWILLALFALQAPVAVFTATFLSLGDNGALIVLFSIGWLGLALAGWGLTLAPTSRAWFAEHRRTPLPDGVSPDEGDETAAG